MARRPRYVVHRPQKRPVVARVAELEIERLGARGDGIGQFNGKPVFVPLTLPGEKVLARIEGKRGDGFTATATEWLVQAQDRVKAPCRHFGTCGGCSAQHIKDSSYVAWKRGIAVEALGRVGIPENLIAPLMRVPPGTRRRATFAFKKSRDGLAQDRSTPSQPSDSALNVNPSLEQIDRADSRHQSKPPSGFDFRRPALVLGFNAQASHNIVDILECPLLTPDLTTALPMLRQGLAELFPDAIQGDLMVQATEAGLDVLIVAEAPLDLFRRECLARLVHRPDLAQDRSTKQIARISWQSPAGGEIEPVAERQTPVVILGGIAVTPPPGAFLQPSQEGEAAIAAQVVSGLAGLEGPVLDLYCGIGSFSLPLAAHHAVHAVDGNPAAIAA
ncbi:MAG: class I SAM-dependent RNA methyltransferase, partial [Rhodospirillales bacterium]